MPLHWYEQEDHIGYTKAGEKLLKKAKQDRLAALLAKNDLGTQWRTIYDEYNDEEITLSTDEIGLLQRIRQGRFPHIEVSPPRSLSLPSMSAGCETGALGILHEPSQS